MLYYLDFIDTEFEKPNITVATFAQNWYSPKRNLTCEEHLDWGQKFAIIVIVKIIFSNKQKEVNEAVRKDVVDYFQKRHRTIRYENVKCLLKVFDFIFHIFFVIWSSR